MSNNRDGKDPGVYQGVVPSERPRNIISTRAPNANDRRYKIGTIWIDKTNNASYQLTSVVASTPNWELLGSATGAISTITGDSGGALSPTSGNINILGTSADGLLFAGSGSTLTGSVTASSTTQRGTLEIATLDEVFTGTDNTRAITPSLLSSINSSSDITFTQNPVLQAIATTGAAPVGTDTATNIMSLQDGEIMESYNIGTQTIIAPRMAAAGLLVSLDLTDDEGVEYNWGTRANSKHAYTIGTTPAFFLEWNFTLADVTGCDPVGIGFRKQEANNSTLESYTDFAWIGVSESDTTAVISLKTRLNMGSVTTTNTTDAWTNGQTHRLKILVSAAGVVTYEIDGAAPTATAAFTFDAADVVMPFFHGLHGTITPGTWHWVDCKVGLQ